MDIHACIQDHLREWVHPYMHGAQIQGPPIIGTVARSAEDGTRASRLTNIASSQRDALKNIEVTMSTFTLQILKCAELAPGRISKSGTRAEDSYWPPVLRLPIMRGSE